MPKRIEQVKSEEWPAIGPETGRTVENLLEQALKDLTEEQLTLFEKVAQ